MGYFQNLSIKNKLVQFVLITTAVAVGIGLIALVVLELITSREELVANSILQAQFIGDYCQAPLYFEQNDDTREILEKLKTNKYILYAAVFDLDKELFADYSRDQDVIPPEKLPDIESGTFEGNVLHITQEIIYEGKSYGWMYLRVSTESIDIRIRNYLLTIGIIFLVIFVTASFIALRYQGVISGPILKLAAITEKISDDPDTSLRAERDASDELGKLYSGFNRMMEQIEIRGNERDKALDELRRHRDLLERHNYELLELNKALRTFSDSISNELRAPLWRIDGYCKLLQDNYESSLDEDGQRYINQLVRYSQHMTQLINDAMQLSKVVGSRLRLDQVNLSNIVSTVIRELQGNYTDVEIHHDIEPDLICRADKELITIFVRVLLSSLLASEKVDSEVTVHFGATEVNEEITYNLHIAGAGIERNGSHDQFIPLYKPYSGEAVTLTGVELVSAQRIIYLHGGKLSFDISEEREVYVRFTIG